MSVTRRGARRIGLVAAVALLALAPSLAAQGLLDTVQVHGFGGWAYGETDGNKYFIGTESGRYDNADFALNISAEPMEGLTIVAQLRGEAVAGEDNFELDYAFANYAFSDQFNARIGRVKHPLGLYGEIADVGTLRPFYTLPPGIYGPKGFTARAYNGVGVVGRAELGRDWALIYDVYGGQIEGDFVVSGLTTTVPELALVPEVDLGFRINQTLGTRLKVQTPVDGLSFGLSGFTGDEEIDLAAAAAGDEPPSRNVYVASLEYLGSHLWFRGEAAKMDGNPHYENEAYYLEAAYKLTERWQVAARWDSSEVILPGGTAGLPPIFEQLLYNDEASLGVNYWFGTNLVVRLSYHQVEGNRHAYLETPQQIQEMLATGVLDKDTDMVVFGAQFSF